MTASATKSELHELVDLLDETQLTEALNLVRELVEDTTRDQPGDNDRFRLGEVIKHGRPTSENDPLWEIVGMVGDDYVGPTDVASNKHKYLADAYADTHDE